MIPAEFTGGWVRVTMALGGAEPFEDTLVWWLQAPSRHADLRVPYAEGEAAISFAGTTVYDAPSLTWLPDLELVPNDFPDTGVVSWDGPDLLEAGMTVVDGASVGYVERWRRIPDSAGPLVALSKPGGRLVRTGSVALTVVDARASGGAFQAVAWRLAEGIWTVDHCWPAQAALAAPPVAVNLAVGASVELSDGDLWNVDEISSTTTLAVTHG